MTKLFCQTCSNIYDEDKMQKLTKCPRCGSVAYSAYASAIKRYFKCSKCKRTFKLSEVAARYFARNKKRPACTKCGGEITSISTNNLYLKDSGQAQKVTDGDNISLDKFGLKTW